MKDRIKRGVECVVLLALATAFAQIEGARAGDGDGGTRQQIDQPAWGTGYRSYVGDQSLSVGATIRSFPSTHPDFRRVSESGPGRYANIMNDELGPDGKPVFRTTGQRVGAEWRDAGGRAIAGPRSYITGRNGDTAGRADAGAGGAVESAQSFSQWFRTQQGVNTASQATLNFQRDGAVSVFDGSLDSITGTSRTDYTAEFEYFFVHEADRDFYISADTNAEIWVFVDGRLVIDGGGIGGVNFTITNGAVVPSESYDATITVIGAAIQSGNTPVPVTLRSRVGTTWVESFGSYASATAGNVNDDRNPRSGSLGTDLPAGTAISVTGRSWLPSNSHGSTTYSSYMEVDSSSGSQNVRVLRNGDTAPDIRPFQNQATIRSFLSPYIDRNTQRVILQANQAIFLFELGTTNMSSSAADFQDLVVLVSLSRPDAAPPPTTTTTTYTAVPSLRQRIDLSRLDWLEDRGTHRLKFMFANRTGAASSLRLETNITTLNLANMRGSGGMD